MARKNAGLYVFTQEKHAEEGLERCLVFS